MTQTVVLSGADAFIRDNRAAQDDLNDLSGPMQAAGRTVLSAARSRAPRLTGRLAGSLLDSAGPFEAQVESTLVYAPVIHWGWRAHGIEPNPFLTTAGRATEPSWIRGFEDAVDRALDRMDQVYAR